MKNNWKIVISIFWIIHGAVLFGCQFAGLGDEYWSGMGGAFIGVGVLQLIRQIRYKTDVAYRERVHVENSDERNRFLVNKAWAWAGYWYVMIAAGVSIIAKLLGYDQLSIMAGISICLIIVLYWLSYLFLRKKY